jgi:hypothetical protein
MEMMVRVVECENDENGVPTPPTSSALVVGDRAELNTYLAWEGGCYEVILGAGQPTLDYKVLQYYPTVFQLIRNSCLFLN